MNLKTMSKSKIAGWVLSVLIAGMLAFSAVMKFIGWEGKEEAFGKLGWAEGVMYRVGVVEAAVAVLFLIPQTAFIGAVLVTAYLGGAVATHVRVSDAFIVPVIMGVLVWVALGLRDARVFRVAFGARRVS